MELHDAGVRCRWVPIASPQHMFISFYKQGQKRCPTYWVLPSKVDLYHNQGGKRQDGQRPHLEEEATTHNNSVNGNMFQETTDYTLLNQ
jgi:hypothetical protein